jgi:uncharacterized iron-regulated membrane protein
MFGSFRLAMTWLHTWFGLVLGFVLTVIFFFGSLSVFDREIDRWAMPETRFEPQSMPSFDAMLKPIFQRIAPEEAELAAARKRVGGPLEANLPVTYWSAYPTHRDPVLSLYAEFAVKNNPDDPDDHVHGDVTIDPRNGNALSDDQLKLGSEFFYPMHYSLHLHWLDLGYWIVGVAALVMLVALVSGVVIHRKLFREFFTFRPDKNTQRRVLDLHNLTGVVALPFHFTFALTGLIIFAGIYFPLSETLLERVHDAHEAVEAREKGLAHERSGVAAPLASVDAMVAEAKRRWTARGMPGEVGFLELVHVGDAKGYVGVYRAGSDRIALVGQGVYFAAPTGELVYEEPAPSAVASVQEFLTGLHLQHFEHWLLRWLYVTGGLSGAACIATGLVFFVGKRRQKHAVQGVAGARWVDALAVTTVTGTLVATLSILVANRLLPHALPERGEWQMRVFWLSWLICLLHAALRTRPVGVVRVSPAWREQCSVVAVLAVLAVVSNWSTTGDHLLRTVGRGYWPVAGLDLTLLVTAAIAAYAAVRLKRGEALAGSAGADPDALDATAEAAHG